MSKAVIYHIDKKTGEKKVVFDRIMRNAIYMLRADNPSKSLSEKASKLLTNYYDMINDSHNGIIFVNHEFISGKTRVGNRQNNRLHEELRDIFNIQYHKSAIVEGKKFHYGFTIEFTENTEIILKDPKLFYSSQMAENVHSTRQKCPLDTTKMSTPLYIEEENLKENLKDRSIEIPKNIPRAEESQGSNFSEKTLKDFYPITQEDCHILQRVCGREFRLNVMNEILLDMSKRIIRPMFRSKKGFLNYMGIAFKNEMRDTVKTDNETFKIKNNLTDEEKEATERNKYLQQMENSNDPFKKFIASRFSERKAYDFLSSFRSIKIKNDVVQIYLDKDICFTESDQKLILEQVKLTHKVSSGKIDFGAALAQMIDPNRATTKEIEKIELISEKPEIKMQNNNLDSMILQKFGAVKGQDIIKNCSIKKLPEWNRRLYPHGAIEVKTKFGESMEEADKQLLRICIREAYGEKVAIVAAKEKYYDSDENELWKQFKEFTQKHFRSNEDANTVLSSWFAKLKPSQNIGANKLIFSGTKFMIDWVDSNYSGLIEDAVKQLKTNIELIYEDNCTKPILYESGIGKFKRLDEETINRLMNQKVNMEEVK